jgi:hypothetical protein
VSELCDDNQIEIFFCLRVVILLHLDILKFDFWHIRKILYGSEFGELITLILCFKTRSLHNCAKGKRPNSSNTIAFGVWVRIPRIILQKRK